MLNIADTLHTWCREGRPFALATVVRISGSAPLPLGSAMAVDGNGSAIGSVSGGCVEGAVYEQCRQALEDHTAPVCSRFGYSDDDAFAVGLTCGGELDILIQRVDPAHHPHLTAALHELASARPTALAQIVSGPDEALGRTLYVTTTGTTHHGTTGDGARDQAVAAHAHALLHQGRIGRVEIGGESATCPQSLSVLVHTRASRPRMLIFGAVDFAGPLSEIGTFLGYRVTVCDARAVFATRARFPHADDVVADWPHRYLASTDIDPRTAVCVLTHDAKFDIPLLRLALSLPLGYVGALGSRRTHSRRLQLLQEAGVPEEHLARLHSPIGLDLGAHTPQQTAISITAEIIAHTHQASTAPLTRTTGPIHHRTTP